jgi:hypothetical protein
LCAQDTDLGFYERIEKEAEQQAAHRFGRKSMPCGSYGHIVLGAGTLGPNVAMDDAYEQAFVGMDQPNALPARIGDDGRGSADEDRHSIKGGEDKNTAVKNRACSGIWGSTDASENTKVSHTTFVHFSTHWCQPGLCRVFI